MNSACALVVRCWQLWRRSLVNPFFCDQNWNQNRNGIGISIENNYNCRFSGMVFKRIMFFSWMSCSHKSPFSVFCKMFQCTAVKFSLHNFGNGYDLKLWALFSLRLENKTVIVWFIQEKISFTDLLQGPFIWFEHITSNQIAKSLKLESSEANF